MELYDNKRRQIQVFSAVMAAFLAAGAIGIYHLYNEGYGLIYELSYALLLLIGLAFVFDRLFVR